MVAADARAGAQRPARPWSPPPAPWTSGARQGSALADAIAYWAPLTTLTWGVLGWARPDLGVQRWVAAGRPTDRPQLMVLDRWWGEDALAAAAWMQTSEYPQGYSRRIHERTGTGAIATPHTAPVRARPEWHDMLDGGDALHLGHVLDHLLGPGFPPDGPQLGRLVHDPPTSSARDAHLVLDTYCGWYGTLARLGGRPACATRWPVVAGARHREAAGLPRHLPAVAADREVVRRSA